MRLIDAEALMKEANEEGAYGYVDVTQIANAPTIEAKPVVHAHWEEKHSLHHICSECHHDAPYKMNGYDAMEDLSAYCPNCGAQMDESVKIPVISMEDVPKLAKESD
jgi:hypothetical protein